MDIGHFNGDKRTWKFRFLWNLIPLSKRWRLHCFHFMYDAILPSLNVKICVFYVLCTCGSSEERKINRKSIWITLDGSWKFVCSAGEMYSNIFRMMTTRTSSRERKKNLQASQFQLDENMKFRLRSLASFSWKLIDVQPPDPIQVFFMIKFYCVKDNQMNFLQDWKFFTTIFPSHSSISDDTDSNLHIIIIVFVGNIDNFILFLLASSPDVSCLILEHH